MKRGSRLASTRSRDIAQARRHRTARCTPLHCGVHLPGAVRKQRSGRGGIERRERRRGGRSEGATSRRTFESGRAQQERLRRPGGRIQLERYGPHGALLRRGASLRDHQRSVRRLRDTLQRVAKLSGHQRSLLLRRLRNERHCHRPGVRQQHGLLFEAVQRCWFVRGQHVRRGRFRVQRECLSAERTVLSPARSELRVLVLAVSMRSLFRTLFVSSVAGMSCTFLADFEDKSAASPAATSDGPRADGGIVVIDSGAARGDAPSDASFYADAVSELPDTAPAPFTCVGKPDGTPVPGSSLRCCSEVSTDLTSNANCGACNIQCNVGRGHSCVTRSGHAYCDGCATDAGGGSAQCWTGCCTAPALTNGICAPEFPCGVIIPVCSDSTCAGKAVGTSCHTSFFGSYCSY